MKRDQNRLSFKIFKALLIACCLMPMSSAILAKASGAEISGLLASAKKVVLYSLEPGEAGTRDANDDCAGLCYFGWPVLGQVEISRRASIVGQVTSWFKNSERDEKALCFDPRHGIRILTAEKTIDFVICFECENVEVYINSKFVGLSPHPDNIQREWDRLLKKAGVPLAAPFSD